MPGIVSEVAGALTASGIDLERWGLAWARATPTVVLVPAFGLRALPGPARAMMGLVLSLAIFPAITAQSATTPNLPWVALALAEALRGLPIAIAAAVPLWAATMAGGAVDSLRGTDAVVSSPVVEGRPSPLGVPMSILASFIFLAQGGPARVALALATRPAVASPALAVAHDLSSGITLAVAVAAPLLGAAVVIEVAGALAARAAAPSQVHSLFAPLRSLAVLCVLAVVIDRIAAVLALAMV